MLTPAQLEDLEKISIGIDKINQLRIRINALAEANGFTLPRLKIPELGMVAHAVEGISFEHQVALAKMGVK